MRTDPPKHFFSSTGQLRSRWRLCRLTDAAYPLRVRRILFLMSQKENGGGAPLWEQPPAGARSPPARRGGHQAAFPRRNRRAVIMAESPGRQIAAQ